MQYIFHIFLYKSGPTEKLLYIFFSSSKFKTKCTVLCLRPEGPLFDPKVLFFGYDLKVLFLTRRSCSLVMTRRSFQANFYYLLHRWANMLAMHPSVELHRRKQLGPGTAKSRFFDRRLQKCGRAENRMRPTRNVPELC